MTAGALMTCAVTYLMPYSAYVESGSRISFGYVPMGTLMPFMVLAVVLNPVLKLFGRRLGFNTGELTVIFIMGFAAAIFPTLGLCGFLVAVLATPYYFASNENQWHHYLIPYLPRWALPSNEGGAMAWFFNGKPVDASIPWDAWIRPLLWWSCFVAALFTLSFSIMAILRRQWMDNERLVYPLAQLPIELVAEDEHRVLPTIMRQRLFWIGLCVPLGIILCAGKKQERIELLELGQSGIHVAEYLTALPPRELLQRKLHDAIERSRRRLENREVDA